MTHEDGSLTSKHHPKGAGWWQEHRDLGFLRFKACGYGSSYHDRERLWAKKIHLLEYLSQSPDLNNAGERSQENHSHQTSYKCVWANVSQTFILKIVQVWSRGAERTCLKSQLLQESHGHKRQSFTYDLDEVQMTFFSKLIQKTSQFQTFSSPLQVFSFNNPKLKEMTEGTLPISASTARYMMPLTWTSLIASCEKKKQTALSKKVTTSVSQY